MQGMIPEMNQNDNKGDKQHFSLELVRYLFPLHALLPKLLVVIKEVF